MTSRIVIPDTLVLIPCTSGRAEKETEPVVSIVTSKGKYSTTRLQLSTPMLRAIGYDSNAKQKPYVQVFASSQTIKIVSSVQGKPNARAITSGGYISVRELGDLMRLPQGSRFRCKAEVVKNKGWEIWATYPPELREHIERLNGVVS